LPELEAQFIRGGTEKYLVERASPTEPVSRVLRYFSQDLLDYIPEWMREMHRSHQNRIINETLCVLYVALTRAVHALHIVVPVDGKSESSTAARLLLNAVGVTAPAAESVVYQLGDPDWISKWVPEAPEIPVLREPADVPPIRLAPPGPVRRRNLNYVTPSSQGGARLTPQALLPEEVSLARARGSLIHAWCEQIEWLDENPPEADLLTGVAGRFARPGLDLPELIRWFDRKIRAGDFAENLTSTIYRTKIAPQLFRDLAADCPLDDCQFEVLRERRLTFRNGDDLVNGTADRLVLVRHNDQVVAADVIDFKTDTVQSDADIEHLREIYREQLRLYRLAIAAIYRVLPERIAARLALVSASRVVSVD